MKKPLLFLPLTILLIPFIVSATHAVTINFPQSGDWTNGTIEIVYNVSGGGITNCYMNVNGNTTEITCFSTTLLDTAQCNDGSDTCFLEIIVTGDHGNASDNVTFSVDNSPPTITFVSLNASVAKQGDSINITSDGNDTHGVKSCWAFLRHSNGTDMDSYNLGLDCDDVENLPNPLEEGNYTINVRVRNKVSVEAWANTSLTIDNTLPIANITSLTSDGVGTMLINMTGIYGNASDDNFMDYKLEYCQDSNCFLITIVNTPQEGGFLGNWDTRTTSNGNYTLKLTVKDIAQNSQTDSINVTVNNTFETLFPNNFSGYVSVGGVQLSNGSTLKARINGVEFASTGIINGMYGIDSVFSFPSDNLSSEGVEGGVNGDAIEFFVDGTKTNENAVFASGDSTELNLTISTPDNLTVINSSDNMSIEIFGNDTIDMDIEIRTNQNVFDASINLSKFTKNFLGGFSNSEKFLKSVSVEVNESIIEYIILKIFYENNEIDSNNLNEDNLILFRFNETLSDWEEVSSTTNKGNNYVTVNLSSASMFALAGIQTCSDGIENQDEEGVDCGGSCSEACGTSDGSSDNSVCVEDWECTAWSECIGNVQERDCDDLNNCGTTVNKSSESRLCEEIICTDGERICSDYNITECQRGTEWVVIKTCEFGCFEGSCLGGNDTNISSGHNISSENVTDSKGVTGFLTAENAVFVSGIVIVVVILVVVAVVSRRREKPVYKAFRYDYKAG